MADVMIHSTDAGQVTCIPNAFIDGYMKDANGEYVKVYLYLQRCLAGRRMDLSIPSIADALDLTEKDVRRALRYWEKKSLIRLEYNDRRQLTGICLLDLREEQEALLNPSEPDTAPYALLDETDVLGKTDLIDAAAQTVADSAGAAQESPAVSGQDTADKSSVIADIHERPFYSPAELGEFQKDDSVKEMLYITGCYIGHPLTVMEMNTFLYWHQSLHFSTDLIEYLVEYCVEKEHNSIYYMDKVALRWADEHITTPEEARAANDTHSKLYYHVMNAFGISGRRLASSEVDYLRRWTVEYGMDEEMILEACRRTISNTSRASFEYADSILKSWEKAGAHHIPDIALLDQEHDAATHRKKKAAKTANIEDHNRFHRFAQNNYDMDALGKSLISNK